MKAVITFALLTFAAPSALAEETPPAQAAAEPVQAAVDKSSPDYMRCRRIATTGSLARKERVCKTNAEWERIARAGNDSARDAIERAQTISNPQP